MSFSSKVKDELSEQFGNARHCHIAELAGILNMCGEIASFDGKNCVKIQTENAGLARKYFTLLQKAFNINCDVRIRSSRPAGKNRIYQMLMTQEADELLHASGLIQEGANQWQAHLSPLVVSSVCCRRAYLRGAFLGSGSVSDPEKAYHLEFVHTEFVYSQQLQELLHTFDLDAKIIERKEHYVTYLKESDQIVQLLNIMGAHMALMAFENVRIVKEMRNTVNRKVNCETANLNKTVSAAVRQLEDIAYIDRRAGLGSLPATLESIARLRLMHPEASLKELGDMMCPPVGKSGVNHRLRKLSSIAETMREGKGDLK